MGEVYNQNQLAGHNSPISQSLRFPHSHHLPSIRGRFNSSPLLVLPMAAASLLESPLKWKLSYPIQLPPRRLLPPPNTNPRFIGYCYTHGGTRKPKGFAKIGVKCFFSSPNSSIVQKDESFRKKSPLEIAADSVLVALKALTKPAIVAVMLGLLLTYDPSSALAASGGRMGGSSFSSRSSSSSSSSSRSYHIRTDSPAFSYSAPYGFGGGYYAGPAVGVGVGAGSTLFLIMLGFAAFILVSGFLSDRSDGSVLTATDKTSVLKLQVGLLGMGRSLQRHLNKIAESADTSTPQGLSYVLTETTLALLRKPDYCISGYSSVDVKRSLEDGEKRFNQLSIEERGKFDEETLVNVNNIKRQSTSTQRATGFSNEYIVITILVAAEGVHKLPTINGSKDLKESLQKLASIPSSKIMAVEVLWTPQNENDTLTERELLEDYPLLRPL